MVGKVANVISRRLNIQCGVTQLEAILVIAFDRSIGALNQTAAQLLGPMEAAYYSSLCYLSLAHRLNAIADRFNLDTVAK